MVRELCRSSTASSMLCLLSPTSKVVVRLIAWMRAPIVESADALVPMMADNLVLRLSQEACLRTLTVVETPLGVSCVVSGLPSGWIWTSLRISYAYASCLPRRRDRALVYLWSYLICICELH